MARIGINTVGVSPDGRNVLGIDVVNGCIVRLSYPGSQRIPVCNPLDDILPEISHQLTANTNKSWDSLCISYNTLLNGVGLILHIQHVISKLIGGFTDIPILYINQCENHLPITELHQEWISSCIDPRIDMQKPKIKQRQRGLCSWAVIFPLLSGIMLRKYCHLKYIVIGLFLVVALLTLITVAITQNLSSTRNRKYGIVLDAGSSHTNVYVYEWPAEKENNTGMVHQIHVCEVEGPGISSYVNAVENASVPLKHCMDSAKEIVPQGKHQETPVYLGATAGMRLLSLKNKDAARRVLSEVEETLRIYPFKFQGARILSGEEEGAYGWITLNYLLGKFTESIWPKIFPHAFFKSRTTGALDLGGASTQITFVPDPDKIELPTDIINFHLYGKEYRVYTHSFLCYGKDQALRLKLLQDVLSSTTDRLQDPCFHQGYVRTLNVFDLTTNPCTAHNITAPYSQIQIQGDGNYEKCLESIQRIFNTEDCPYSSCSFNGVVLPEVSGEFGAFSAFYYVMSFLNVTEKPMDQVIETVKNFCSKSWNEVKVEFPKIKEKYLSEYCFSSTYIISLLVQRYNFTEEKWQSIHFLEKVQKSDAGWTLGYMLNLTNMIPAEQPYTHLLSHTGFISFMVICSALVMTLLLIGWIIYHKPKCLRKEII